MTCEELLKALNDYIDGAELDEVCEEFAEHLAGCNPCQVVVDNIRQTIALFHHGKPFDLPIPFQNALQETLKSKWHEKFGEKSTSS